MSDKKPARILVVDDDQFLLESMIQMLSVEYSHVEGANSAEKGLEILKGSSFDLCISDYKMQGMNGAQFLKEIRKFNSKIPLILVSGVIEGDDIKEAMKLGASRFLAKPFEILTFLDLVELQLAKQK